MLEKIRLLEDILEESGGFGCEHVNEAYVEEEFQESEYNEEESGGDEVESDSKEDLCDEDEEYFEVNKVSDVEKEPILTPGFVQVNDEDYGNDFLNDDENVEDYDQGKCFSGQGNGSGSHEGNIRKNHVEGKGDDDEDDEQGNGSGCNNEEAMNLNSVVENVTKSVGLIDSQEGTNGCLNQKLVEDDVNLNLTDVDDATVNLGEDDHKNKIISDHTVDTVIVVKKDGEGGDVEDCSNKNKDGENVEDCSNKKNDSNETRSLKNDIVPSFSLGFSQDSEVSFAPPLGTLEGPSKLVSGKPKDINGEATSVVDVKGKKQMKISYVYKSTFKERLIDFKPSLTQVENVVCEWLLNLQGNPG
ncbi:unnamed protein product [Lactuca saligna]|uniref:Uncharacterized protein n=1 Tax=Lactuca saligna TaxID=75948 RepID=A0AA35Y2U3_LACSI|nr:unnamed protein product [Lactuca saligna]